MCGIVGIVSRKKSRIKEKLVKKALLEISHRGPDDMNIFTNDNVSFGYVRLAIRGLDKRYNQPIVFDNIVSFSNGEVYSKNGKSVLNSENDLTSLIKDIINKEVIIYKQYDADFAASIYDKCNNIFILARDYFGVKPLFYTWLDDETLLFSSEIKGLFVLLENKYEFDNDSILDYLLFGYPLYKKTIYKKIYRLEPRTILKWNLKTNKKEELKEKLKFNYRSKVENLTDYLRLSIKNRLISDRKIGSHLSGGFDSSLIAYFSKNNLDYYTGYYNKDDNDYFFSKEVANDINAKHRLIKLKDKIDIRKLITILDAPVMSTGAYVPYQIASSASQDNVKVLLAGQGADELFLGYSRFKNIKKLNSKKELLKELFNADLNMINKLFFNIDIDKKYRNILNSNNYLKEAQKFYIDNFLTELLHIEDHLHMNFGIENRVPFLGLDIIKFINKYGICDSCNKQDILQIHNVYKTKLLNRNLKENMNKSLKHILKKEKLDNVLKNKIFDNFDYDKFSEYIKNIDNLNKKELYTIWFIYNIDLWYREHKFKNKIMIGV